MSWVVDTCIVIDVLENDPSYGLSSATLLQEKLVEGLSISPVTFVELAPAFGGDLQEQERFLELAGIEFRSPWTMADTQAAHQAWHIHIAARRSGAITKRPVADLLIGAFASNRRGLITRNPKHFQRNFPNLEIITPGNP